MNAFEDWYSAETYAIEHGGNVVEIDGGKFIVEPVNDAPPQQTMMRTVDSNATETIKIDELRNAILPIDTISFEQLMANDYKPNWLIENLIEKYDLGLIFGSSGGGKSFITLEMCYCVASGLPFHGKATKKGTVLYVCGEGHSGIQKRFNALHQTHNGIIENSLHLTTVPAAFMDAENAKTVRERMDLLGGVNLVVIDTFHRNMGNGDENSAKDFAVFLQNIDRYIKTSGAAVIIVHHSGNDSAGRSRGSSSIRAAMDVEYQVVKDVDDIVTMTNTKMKNFEPPKPMAFKFQKVAQSVVLELTEIVESQRSRNYLPMRLRRCSASIS